MLQGFKHFILRGNAVDLAVGVVIGAAFNGVVSSLVKDVLTPLIAAIAKEPDFSRLAFTIRGSHFLYGEFLNSLIAFLLVAAAVYFFVVLPMNKFLHQHIAEGPKAPETKMCPECLSDIPVAAKRCGHCTQLVASAE